MIELDKEQNAEPTEEEVQQYVNQVYEFTADLLANKGKSSIEAQQILVSQCGLSQEDAETVVTNLEKQIKEAKSEAAGNDLLYGFLWCIGGIALTAITGGQYLFWGAVVYGIYRMGVGAYRKL